MAKLGNQRTTEDTEIESVYSPHLIYLTIVLPRRYYDNKFLINCQPLDLFFLQFDGKIRKSTNHRGHRDRERLQSSSYLFDDSSSSSVL